MLMEMPESVPVPGGAWRLWMVTLVVSGLGLWLSGVAMAVVKRRAAARMDFMAMTMLLIQTGSCFREFFSEGASTCAKTFL